MNATTLEDPIYFIKPSSSILLHKRVEPLATIEIPERGNVHHELELAVIIGKKGKNISEENAMSYVAGYCLALDVRFLLDLIVR
jgi:acylpyruvate hydrolase